MAKKTISTGEPVSPVENLNQNPPTDGPQDNQPPIDESQSIQPPVDDKAPEIPPATEEESIEAEKIVKVRALQSFGTISYSPIKGDVLEVVESLANDWIKYGLAEEV